MVSEEKRGIVGRGQGKREGVDGRVMEDWRRWCLKVGGRGVSMKAKCTLSSRRTERGKGGRGDEGRRWERQEGGKRDERRRERGERKEEGGGKEGREGEGKRGERKEGEERGRRKEGGRSEKRGRLCNI